MPDISPEKIFKLAPPEQQAEIERLVREGRAEVLIQLKRKAPDKAAARAISQALHRLRSKGVKAEEPQEQRTFVLAKGKEPEQAAVTSVDAAGGRLIWIYRQTPQGGTLFQAMPMYPRGLQGFEAYVATAKRFERVLKHGEKELNVVLARVSPDFARRLIFQAVAQGRSKGNPPPKEFIEAKAMLGPEPDLAAPHPLWAAFDPEAVRAKSGLVFEGPKLLQHKVFAGWYFDEDSVRRCALKLEEAEVSPLVMADEQKRARQEELMIASAREGLAAPGREVWKDRLIENAYVLHLLGEAGPAELALATALALDDPEKLPALFPAMMRRAFRFAEKSEPPPPEPAGRIILP
jgi:hypothetical protein